MLLAPRPQVIMRRGTTKAADYWALGVLIFEMLVGDPPFKSLTGDPWDTFRRALSGRFYVPNFISDQAADLIFKLLQVGGGTPRRRNYIHNSTSWKLFHKCTRAAIGVVLEAPQPTLCWMWRAIGRMHNND